MPLPMAEHSFSNNPLFSSPLRHTCSWKTPASLSREAPHTAAAPTLLHTLHTACGESILSVAADDRHIFSGNQNYDIHVWERASFTVKTTLRGHTGSVLALEIAPDKHWLFSSSGDSTVRIWCTDTLTPLYIVHPYLGTDSGDLFSLTYIASLCTVYIGCQNTSLQWLDLKELCQAHQKSAARSTPYGRAQFLADSDTRRHSRSRFFDSQAPWEERSGGSSDGHRTPNRPPRDIPSPLDELNIERENVIDSAHYGYVYSMSVIPPPPEDRDREDQGKEVLLVTGSGDESVKLWKCTPEGPTLLHTFGGCDGAVLSIVASYETVYAGCQEGQIKVFDLETKTLIRTIIAQEGIDILSLSMIEKDLYSCSANGRIQRWSALFDCTASWEGHDGIILSSSITQGTTPESLLLITGANDNCIKLWDIEAPEQPKDDAQDKTTTTGTSDSNDDLVYTNDRLNIDGTMEYALSKFVSIPSVSGDAAKREDCRQAAIWLRKCFTQLGADATMLPTAENINPLVLATFHGTSHQEKRLRVLFYGHYDVIPAPADGWNSDPFTLTGRNGYLYGRGITDNKGPIMAVACAASELRRRRALGCDLVFVIEGEEESGSAGFEDAVKRHKSQIGDIDAILVSNSTWISEDRPCITYGLRGVVHCNIEISSNMPDLHSGVEGGAVKEPMMDMVTVLAKLCDNGKVLVPAFYDKVRTQTTEEKELYEKLSEVTKRPASSLFSRWSQPSLTVHSMQYSGPGNETVIPATVKAKVSVRIVPDQELDVIAKSLCDHISKSFDDLGSPNKIKVNIDNTADWWLGDLDDPWFKALEGAVRDEWDVEPLRIREGGSIPSVPYLEKEFGCHALHLPLGQSTDQAHLPNERISLANLRRGKSVIERFLIAASKSCLKSKLPRNSSR